MPQYLHVSAPVAERMREDVAAQKAQHDERYRAAMVENRARLRELKHQLLVAQKQQAWKEVKRIKAQVLGPLLP
jgi:hypothetical protein